MSTTTNEDNVNEVIEIVKAVKRHLQDEDCVHGLRYIINEAYQNQSKKSNGSTRATTNRTFADVDAANKVPNLNDYNNRVNS